MLQALELLGFKSFADKTRFEFPPGITVIVGPNGSGKSNIVDALKWVLGAQSAKGLRGQEMADVIFKGSGSGNRKPMNAAEASIVFDNSDGRLPVDAPEVHVTRRVYRSGEGEYMINGNPCRLRDIKDLFSGTGLGTGAYSLIEQGKVDTLLQASPKDRRAILEEAAGISRFKAKKVEAQRRLERVDQNLLRLSDIVDEVDSRLRSVRAQASKARRYQEYTAQLQALRTQASQVDWRRLTRQLQAADAEVGELSAEVARVEAEAHDTETRAQTTESRLEGIDRDIADAQGQISQNREAIAVRHATIEHRRRQCDEFEGEAGRFRLQAAVLQNRAGDVRQQLDDTLAAFQKAEREYDRIEQGLQQLEATFAELSERSQLLRNRADACRSEHVDRMQQAAALGSQISACRSQLETAGETLERCRARHAELTVQCREQHELCQGLQADEQELVDGVRVRREELAESRRVLDRSRVELTERQHELSDLQGRRSGAAERASVIEELEERLEGVGAGVKEALRRAAEEPEGPFSEIHSLVADGLRVEVEHAGMVEVALGEAAHHLVVSGHRLLTFLQSGHARLPGRVGFVPLTAAVPRLSADQVDLGSQPGVIGRADQFVQCEPEFQLLVRRLLGRTWFVQKLVHAVALSQSVGRGLRFVTAAGELYEADGTLVVGHGAWSSGIISRRSELAAVRELVTQLDGQIGEAREGVDQQLRVVASQERRADAATAALEQQNAALAEHRIRAQSLQSRYAELKQQLETVDQDIDAAQTRQQSASAELAEKQGQLQEVESSVAELQQQLQAGAEQLKQTDAERQEQNRLMTQAKIELAKSEQRLRGLRAAKEQCERTRQEREDAILQCRAQLLSCTRRRHDAEREILNTQAELALQYIVLETFSERWRDLAEERTGLQQQRARSVKESKTLRDRLHKLEHEQHEKELLAGQIRHERRTLADRLREDYGVEISELDESGDQDHEQQPADADEEIASLRRKISNIGAVNLEALEELDDLEERFRALSGQYQDLQAAKVSLDRIISKINADSRRLFSETLEAVRENFRALFRKVFGGGTADIVLEDENDLLETGIEILANPPGKQSLPISLLSGGERALTAVTLLLALFQFRPSPFCVLDEVDGPLDEANIGRFVDVLKGFLSWTRFVIVTHSKKTMTAATTLYGVTMQESGVSKRVSVRFEDITDSGHIDQAAIDREQGPPAPEEDERGAA